jgi:uncharacterized protein (DUF488 family)
MGLQMMVYTLGTSRRPVSEVLDILKKYKITAVVDIRKDPAKSGRFEQKKLAKVLCDSGVSYHWIKRLSGMLKYPWPDYVTLPDFKLALFELITIAEDHTTLILCSEGEPRKCHRRFVANELVNMTWGVTHILTKTKTERHGKIHS